MLSSCRARALGFLVGMLAAAAPVRAEDGTWVLKDAAPGPAGITENPASQKPGERKLHPSTSALKLTALTVKVQAGAETLQGTVQPVDAGSAGDLDLTAGRSYSFQVDLAKQARTDKPEPGARAKQPERPPAFSTDDGFPVYLLPELDLKGNPPGGSLLFSYRCDGLGPLYNTTAPLLWSQGLKFTLTAQP